MELIEEKVFEGLDFSSQKFEIAEYEHCKFIKCNFHETDVRGAVFSDVIFDQCDLAMMKINNSSFREVVCSSCKMIGIQFDHINPFGLSVKFVDTNLDHSNFYKVIMRKTNFINCSLKEVDFSDSDLTACVFDNCDFHLAIFDSTVLNNADFRTSYNYSIDPIANKIKQSRHSYPSVLGLVNQLDILID
ncbi:MAG: hypothetical protein RI965_91 [Bacteroidota bacterium]|jgi:uncharacterized protein YjbI with pentapeptide repeats